MDRLANTVVSGYGCWYMVGNPTVILKNNDNDTVDGRNPAPVDRWFIPLFIGF